MSFKERGSQFIRTHATPEFFDRLDRVGDMYDRRVLPHIPYGQKLIKQPHPEKIPDTVHFIDPKKNKLIVKPGTRYFMPNLETYQTSHLAVVEQAVKENKKVLFVANHLSHADHPAIVEGLQRDKDFGHLASRIFVLAGQGFANEERTQELKDALNTIDVWQITHIPETEEELAYAKELTKKLVIAKRELWPGNIFLAYPEASRSDTCAMNEFKSETASLFRQADLIVPVSVNGTQYVWPKHGDIQRYTGPVTVIFGEPYRVEKSTSVSHQDIVDEAGNKIALYLPSEMQGYYQQAA